MTDILPPAERDTLPPSEPPPAPALAQPPDWFDALLYRAAQVMADRLCDTLDGFRRDVSELRTDVQNAVTRQDKNYDWLRKENRRLKERCAAAESRLTDLESWRAGARIELDRLRCELAQLRERMRP